MGIDGERPGLDQEQVDILIRAVVPPARITAGYCDTGHNPENQVMLANRGDSDRLDTSYRPAAYDIAMRAEFVRNTVSAGFEGTPLLSRHVRISSRLTARGDDRCRYLRNGFLPRLRADWLAEPQFESQVAGNPGRALGGDD